MRSRVASEQQPLPLLLLDEKEIRRLVLNLVDNALYVTPTGETVKIRTYIEQGRIVLEMSGYSRAPHRQAWPAFRVY